MSLLLPGMHVAGGTPVHRLDPRVKMGASLLLMVLPFLAPSLPSNLLLAGFVVALVILSAVPMMALVRTLRVVVWTGIFMFVFRLFTTPGTPLLTVGGISVTLQGLGAGAVQIYRLSLLVVVSSLLTYTTSPAQLAHGLEAVLGPLARLGLPVREFAMVLTIALRFVPTLFEEIEKIVKAQESRGALIRTGPLWKRVPGWVPVFVPLFVSAFRRAEDLATAMEARGFRSAHQRTRLYRLHLTRRDLAASLLILALGAVILFVEWRMG